MQSTISLTFRNISVALLLFRIRTVVVGSVTRIKSSSRPPGWPIRLCIRSKRSVSAKTKSTPVSLVGRKATLFIWH